MLDVEEESTEELQRLFKKSHPAYDLSNLKENNAFRKVLMTADATPRYSTPKPTTAIRLGTPSGFQRMGTGVVNLYRPITGFRPPTGVDGVNRPMTAVRGAGYTSHGRPKDQRGLDASPQPDSQKGDSPQRKILAQEQKIMQLIEESCAAASQGQFKNALDKAKDASNKERSLIRLQDQAGLGDNHNLELTYTVLLTLANQYANNELHTEALNTYQLITQNTRFANAYKLKINLGNLLSKKGQYTKAIKMYRMALDQVPSTEKSLRIKILHNIAMVFVKTREWLEAATNLQHIMSEQPSHRAGLHLILCCMALDDTERMRSAFNMILSVPLELEDEEKYALDHEDPNDRLLAAVIRNDDLHTYEKKIRNDAEHCILTSAKLISPLIENNFAEGYDWCVEAIKSSEYARLAADLEINKAVMFLKQKQLPAAIDILKTFSNEAYIAGSAAINLSFIYFHQRDYESAEKYATIMRNLDSYNAAGFVNLGACAYAKKQMDDAKNCFLNALDLDPSCFEALYNLGLVLKQQGHFEESLECFRKISGSLALLPEVVYQIACIFEQTGDMEAAIEAYQQLLGLVPADANVMQKLGELYDSEGDKQQAHHYHVDSFRYNPANLSVIDWLGSYYIEMQVVEKALVYFEKATIMQPNEPKWQMMVAGCHRRSGNLHKALNLYQEIHRRFPENVECLRFLIRLCSDLGMRDAQDYALELKKLQRSREVRDRVGSSRPGSRRTNSGLSSRGGSGFSPLPEYNNNNNRAGTPFESGNHSDSSRSLRFYNMNNSAGSTDSGFAQPNIDASYSDPLGPMPVRPRTAGKPTDFEDFGDEELGDDLLPQ